MRLPSTIIQLALACALLLVRVPSLAQPMGGDQALYAYVGDQIHAGGLPYRDAWDQKPPAIHFLYAGLRTVWADDGVVALADLIAAALVAWCLWRACPAEAGHQTTNGASPQSVMSPVGRTSIGANAALIFLFLSNPAFTRLGGVRLRSQCETFIAVLLVAALVMLVKHRDRPSTTSVASAGALFGLAFTFKYNVAIFAVAGVLTLWLWRRLTLTDLVKMVAGFCMPVIAMLMLFAMGGALRALYDATILYNVQYSGHTYASPLDVLRYLITFPIERARADALWTVGGAGCLLLIAGVVMSRGRSEWRERVVPIVWVAAACLSIAINGSRSLPQYFIQANPFLALAAASGAALGWTWIRTALGPSTRSTPVAAAALTIVAIGVWRVNQFPKLVEQTVFDARRLAGSISRDDYLARYDDERKYSAIASVRLGEYLRARTTPSDRVYVFGFTSGAYLHAQRASASRFFWSYPVIVGFKSNEPGYGAPGVLADLTARPPAIVALQQQDWPDVVDSRTFFLSTPALAGWLSNGYQHVTDGPEGFDIWMRRSVTP
jgi:hypothetical protein